jgi:hypothetical protein
MRATTNASQPTRLGPGPLTGPPSQYTVRKLSICAKHGPVNAVAESEQYVSVQVPMTISGHSYCIK